MKKIFKISTILLIIAIVITLFAGCVKPFDTKKAIMTNDNFSVNEESPADIAIVVGAHANSMAINLNDSNLNNDLFNTIKAFNGNSISIICCDGDPYLYDQITIPQPEVNLTKQQRIDAANSTKSDILDLLGGIEAHTAEVDTLKAIELAARMLSSSNALSKRLYVLDTCIQTKGVIDFTEISLRCNPTDVVNKINNVYTYTDLKLSNIDIVFSGLGDVYSPQPSLSSVEKENLQTIWNGICSTAGAKSITISSQVSSQGVDSALFPKVSIVETTADKVDTSSLMEQAIIFDDNSNIRFKSDSYEFIDTRSANKELADIAKLMKNDPMLEIVVVGSTATDGTKEACKTLSLKRAISCKEVLIDNGINSNRIKVIGAGQEKTKYRVEDLDANGYLIESEAKKNRCVIIINQNIPEAKQLMTELA